MIKNNQPLSMPESIKYIKNSKDKDTDIIGFIKKFTKLNPKNANEIRKSIEGLNILKLNSKYISKIIDVLPKNSIDLNKILIDVNLDEDETKKIFDEIKKSK